MSYEIYTVCFLLMALLPVFGFRDNIRMSHSNSVPSSEREIKYQELLTKAGTIGGGIAAGFLYKARVAGAVSDLGGRLGSFDSSTYKPGIKTNDIYYPKWFQGSWKSCSIFDAIEAPLGIDVIGGKTVYQAAQNDLNSELCYTSKFIAQDDVIISDRLFNVEQIAAASMGNNSIVSRTQRPNTKLTEQLQLVVSPDKANGAKFEIILQTTDREQNQPSYGRFQALERCTQIIRPVIPVDPSATAPQPAAVLRKDIETITTYERVSESQIVGRQRTATFLSPADPRFRLAYAREPRVLTDAVDIRSYTVKYQKI